MTAKIFGINRIKIETDGPGVTTLVGMYKCPLNCEFCINNPIVDYYEYSVEELYDVLKIDNLYFEYTGGGICFGGHEPLLQQRFIVGFIKYVKSQGRNWKFGIETSLNAKIDDELLEMLDFIIADVKTMNAEIYLRYTEKNNDMVLYNLKKLLSFNGDLTLRLPLIAGYNNKEDIDASKQTLRLIGYNDECFEVFEYTTELEEDELD